MNGKTIRAIIDNRGIKHVWLSERLGVSKTLLSLWLSEEREIPKDYKIQIADILNIPISELV